MRLSKSLSILASPVPNRLAIEPVKADLTPVRGKIWSRG